MGTSYECLICKEKMPYEGRGFYFCKDCNQTYKLKIVKSELIPIIDEITEKLNTAEKEEIDKQNGETMS